MERSTVVYSWLFAEPAACPAAAAGSQASAACAVQLIDEQLPSSLQAQPRHDVAHGQPLCGRLVASQGDSIGKGRTSKDPFTVMMQ